MMLGSTFVACEKCIFTNCSNLPLFLSQIEKILFTLY